MEWGREGRACAGLRGQERVSCTGKEVAGRNWCELGAWAREAGRKIDLGIVLVIEMCLRVACAREFVFVLNLEKKRECPPIENWR